MPIRFRCPYCNRLLGIARRKAGSEIHCPQCGMPVSVPGGDGADDLSDVDDLLNPNPPAPQNGAAEPEPARPLSPPPAAPRPRVEAPAKGSGPAVAARPPAVSKEPKPAPRPGPAKKPAGDRLFENDDVDAMLGLTAASEALDLDDTPARGPKPVSGPDANTLDDGDGKLVLSPQKATILAIAVVILLGVAFAAGFLIASSL